MTVWSKHDAEWPLLALEIGPNAHPFVILGLDPSIHAVISAAERKMVQNSVTAATP
ncbi:hypothetical protein MPL3365_180317 [Mesorhizobium plurifarium]|uniref:Uncharacterized protein n=1 Tax=Mesorhizobium plurifarium TaxID=69974 RepID=A0A090G757_MESPL|nr:hypothetical protein MPL3365_180317 [Mesorhizobium plurifarium]